MAKTKQITSVHKYVVVKDGIAYAGWDDPSCTPDRETLRSMKENGYILYVDGKKKR